MFSPRIAEYSPYELFAGLVRSVFIWIRSVRIILRKIGTDYLVSRYLFNFFLFLAIIKPKFGVSVVSSKYTKKKKNIESLLWLGSKTRDRV